MRLARKPRRNCVISVACYTLLGSLARADDTSLVGKTVTVVSETATLTFENGAASDADLGDSFKVEKVKGNSLWVQPPGAWLKQSKVILYQDAIDFFTRRIERYNRSDDYDRRGRCWQKRQAHGRAIEDFTEAIRLDPTNHAAFVNRGISREETRRYETAIDDYTAALRIKPDYLPAMSNRGVVWIRWGHYDKAIEDFDAAIRLDPKEPILFNNRGYSHMQQGEYKKALGDLNEALRIDPNYHTPFQNRADVRFRRGEIDQAIADAKTAIRLNPKDPRPHTVYAQILCAKGDYDEALDELKSAVRVDPPAGHNAVAWLRATASEAKMRDGKVAVKHATDACEHTRWKDDVYLATLSAALAESGDFGAAIKRLHEAMEINPNNFKNTRAKMMAAYTAGKPFRDTNWTLHRSH